MTNDYSTQIPLLFGQQNNYSFDNYFAGGNHRVIKMLNNLANGIGEHFVYLSANTGTGKTHLTQAICRQAQLNNIRSVYCPLKNIRNLRPQILDGFGDIDLVTLDDIDCAAGDKNWEEAIFHLYNQILDNKSFLVITSTTPLLNIQFKLRDLQSRLRSMLSLNLEPLTTEEIVHAFQLKATHNGWQLAENVARYIINQYEDKRPSFLFHLLSVIDRASLSYKRRVTIPFVKKILHEELELL